MRLPEERDNEPKMSKSAVYTVVGVILFMSIVLMLVLVLNYSGGSRKQTQNQENGDLLTDSSETIKESDGSYGNGNVQSPDDLDFWDMYPVDSDETKSEETSKKDKDKEKTDPSTDGRHTKVINSDGEEEWILINQYLTKNAYDHTKLVCQSDIMKYYEDGKLVSYVGADISEEQNYVDFVKLKKSGVSFVMLRVGARRYSTGQIITDEYFTDNIKRATDAGLDVGVYFFSQAITEKEAQEEANLVLESIKGYELNYPIVFRMSYISNDTSRIDSLTVDEKTDIAIKFLETVKKAGYVPMVYGTKEWLIKRVDLSRLDEYDIWLSQPGDLPDYPYKFSIWQYALDGNIDGISGKANLNISFIDYSEK